VRKAFDRRLLIALLPFAMALLLPLDAHALVKFAQRAPTNLPTLDGTCANYKWYNLCSGYVWLWSGWPPGEGAGTRFGGAPQMCVAPGNTVKKAITYHRNVFPGYVATDVYLERDNDGDGCPNGAMSSIANAELSVGWNTWTFNSVIPAGVNHVIVRMAADEPQGSTFRLCTDNNLFFTQCIPGGSSRSFYYGVNGSPCTPWENTAGAPENLLMWLIVDGQITGVGLPPRGTSEPATWGSIKGLFR
jgi:hypothetical protein